jgi:hypothetical protein
LARFGLQIVPAPTNNVKRAKVGKNGSLRKDRIIPTGMDRQL